MPFKDVSGITTCARSVLDALMQVVDGTDPVNEPSSVQVTFQDIGWKAPPRNFADVARLVAEAVHDNQRRGNLRIEVLQRNNVPAGFRLTARHGGALGDFAHIHQEAIRELDDMAYALFADQAGSFRGR